MAIRNPETLRCGGVYVDAAPGHEAVFASVCAFFARHGERIDQQATALTLDAWVKDGVLGVAAMPPAEAGGRSWIAIADSAPRESADWVKALAVHCHAALGVDAFWFWTMPKKVGVADSGWAMAGKPPKTSRAWKGVHAAVAGFPHPLFHLADLREAEAGALTASFRIAKDAFNRDLEFGKR
jgi:hypothetical protein